ncbi:MAG: hypothetical protein QOH24_951 [Verrucomicrobiota bacterium]
MGSAEDCEAFGRHGEEAEQAGERYSAYAVFSGERARPAGERPLPLNAPAMAGTIDSESFRELISIALTINNALSCSREQSVAVDDGALVRAASNLTGRIGRDDIEDKKLAVAFAITRGGSYLGADRRGRGMDHIHRDADRHFTFADKLMEQMCAAVFHQRDHAGGGKNFRILITRIVGELQCAGAILWPYRQRHGSRGAQSRFVHAFFQPLPLPSRASANSGAGMTSSGIGSSSVSPSDLSRCSFAMSM